MTTSNMPQRTAVQATPLTVLLPAEVTAPAPARPATDKAKKHPPPPPGKHEHPKPKKHGKGGEGGD